MGGVLATVSEGHRPSLGASARRGIIAFGGGVLVAAVALVLVPEGGQNLPPPATLAAFVFGGLTFAWVDHWLATAAGTHAQFLAMLTDFVPEALALGALLASGTGPGVLLALLIALQNVPEGFNAFEEGRPNGRSAGDCCSAFPFSRSSGRWRHGSGWSSCRSIPRFSER